MEEIIIISEEEQNPFADENLRHNGRGYLQPHITFEFKGIVGEIFDNNHGEYGTDYTVSYNGEEAVFCTKSGKEEDWSTFTDSEFVEAFNGRFPEYEIYTSEDPSDGR